VFWDTAPRTLSRGRILERNPDKSLKSFPPYYSQSPSTALPFSSNSCNLLQLTVSVKEKEGKPDRKPYPLPYGLRNPYRNLRSENSRDYAQKLYVHEFGFWVGSVLGWIIMATQLHSPPCPLCTQCPCSVAWLRLACNALAKL
jgi:hypothetical protein